MAEIKEKIKEFLSRKNEISREEMLEFYSVILDALEKAEIRAAEKFNGEWKVNIWVKEAIMLCFKFGNLTRLQGTPWDFYDKDTLPLHKLTLESKVRLVPGGSSIRGGSHVSAGTVIMPPSYINIGAYIDEGCMIDSHALVGSCAQLGKNVHLSAASQIGGVLEPVGAMPVIIEDNVFVGGNCGIYEGTIVKERAVIGTGVILNASTPVFDNVNGNYIRKTGKQPLTIPGNAVVIAGSRPVNTGAGKDEGIYLYCPVIIKYRDDKTDTAVSLEELLR
jgi:2,3,4,5-tetrahydropyridine-2-carboxylate N-succinyltransferase